MPAVGDPYARTTMPYFCAWCMKRSPHPLQHSTLGRVCQHCLRPFGPWIKPSPVRPPQPARRVVARPPEASPDRSSKYARRRNKVGDRDGWLCWLCGKAVSPKATGDHRPTVDHVKRIREGGGDGMSNLRLAHRSCNMHREGANVEPFAPPLAAEAR